MPDIYNIISIYTVANIPYSGGIWIRSNIYSERKKLFNCIPVPMDWFLLRLSFWVAVHPRYWHRHHFFRTYIIKFRVRQRRYQREKKNEKITYQWDETFYWTLSVRVSIKHATTNAQTNKFLLSWHSDLEKRCACNRHNKLCAAIMIIEMVSGFVVSTSSSNSNNNSSGIDKISVYRFIAYIIDLKSMSWADKIMSPRKFLLGLSLKTNIALIEAHRLWL